MAVDYDPGASEVNQLNRIKLMISVAKANLEEKEEAARAERNANLTKPADEEVVGKLEVEKEKLG